MNSFTQECSSGSVMITLSTSPMDEEELLLGCAVLEGRITDGPGILSLSVGFKPNIRLLNAIAKMVTLRDLRFNERVDSLKCLKNLTDLQRFSFTGCGCGSLHGVAFEEFGKVPHLIIFQASDYILDGLANNLAWLETFHAHGRTSIPRAFYAALTASTTLRDLRLDDEMNFDMNLSRLPPTLKVFHATAREDSLDALCDLLPDGIEDVHITCRLADGTEVVRLIQRCMKLAHFTIHASREGPQSQLLSENISIIRTLERYGASLVTFYIAGRWTYYGNAIERAKDFNRIAAFMCGVRGKGSASRFLWGDGDNALMTRVCEFLT